MTAASDVAAVYWSTFAGAPRYSAWNGQHWQPEQGEPAGEVIVAALTGDGPPLSAFFLDDTDRTHVLALDADAEDGWPAIERIAAALLAAGVVCYTERSRRGGHLWIVVDRVIPAIVGRRALMAAIAAAGLDPADPHLELRPSSDRHTSPFAGGSLRAPWMPHPTTGARYGLLNPATSEPLHPKVAGALLALELADAAAVAALAERYSPPRTITTAARSVGADRTPGAVSAVLAERFGVAAVPGRSIRCPFHEDRHPSMRIAADDRRAWCHAPDCEAHEGGRGITAWQAARLAGAA